jgi:hypothetical protein
MDSAPELRGFVAPGTPPLGVRLDRMWILLNRLLERHRRFGKCGCGRPKDQADHKSCSDCAAGERTHARGKRLRAEKGLET